MKKVGILLFGLVLLVGLTPALYAQQSQTYGQQPSGQQGQTYGQQPSAQQTTPDTRAALPRSEKKFLEKAAKDGLFEMEMARMAMQKASSPEVKNFAQTLVNDHTKANDQLQQIANSKGIALPHELDRSQRKELEKLSKLSGEQFDREYMKAVVKEHKSDVKEFRKQAKEGKDPDLKSFAETNVSGLEHHLDTAQNLSKQEKKG